MISRVEVVGAAFECRDLEPPRSQRSDEADRGGRFADATAGRGDHHARHVEWVVHCCGYYYASRADRTMKKSAVNSRQNFIHQALKLTFLIPRCDPQRDRLGASVREIAQMLSALLGRAGGSPRSHHLWSEDWTVVLIEEAFRFRERGVSISIDVDVVI